MVPMVCIVSYDTYHTICTIICTISYEGYDTIICMVCIVWYISYDTIQYDTIPYYSIILTRGAWYDSIRTHPYTHSDWYMTYLSPTEPCAWYDSIRTLPFTHSDWYMSYF